MLLNSIPNFPVLKKCTRFTIQAGPLTKKETNDHLKYQAIRPGLLQAINRIPLV